MSFAHGEFNKSEFLNLEDIEKKINNSQDIFDRGIVYKKVKIDNSFPKYIVDNKEKFKEWIT
jgi:beta-1,4-mannosyl-glycoprotein beta-1,4-N-acetylglucosaminyltransferase